jgi:hypothetical protein
LSLAPVFVADGPMLVAELFDGSGNHVETWSWA